MVVHNEKKRWDPVTCCHYLLGDQNLKFTMDDKKKDELKKFRPGDNTLAQRKSIFTRMQNQATKYKFPDEDLQAQIILNMCYEIKANSFAVSTAAMVRLLKTYGDYHEPVDAENSRTAALKICNKLVECISDETFKLVTQLTADLSLNLVTQRMVLEEEEEIDLSDIEEIPLTTATKFSTHKTVILEDKDGMLSHKSLDDRIEKLANERAIIREWGNAAQTNRETAIAVVKSYANKDVSSADDKKVQQYLLRCFSHRINHLTKKKSTEQSGWATAPAQRTPNRPATTPQPAQPQPPAAADHLTYHSSGILAPPPPKSGLGPDHPFDKKVVNTAEVQLVEPRVPHPISETHAMQCLAVVNELEAMPPSKDGKIGTHITDRLTR